MFNRDGGNVNTQLEVFLKFVKRLAHLESRINNIEKKPLDEAISRLDGRIKIIESTPPIEPNYTTITQILNNIEKAELIDNNLIIRMQDGTEYNAGELRHGIDGINGKSPEIIREGNHIGWKHEGTENFNYLLHLDELKGKDGKHGKHGLDGEHGRGIVNIDITRLGDVLVEMSDGEVIKAGRVHISMGGGAQAFNLTVHNFASPDISQWTNDAGYITSAAIPVHNALSGLQGGTTNEYYHLTSAEYTVVQNTSGTNTGDQTITLTGDVTGSGTGSFATTIKTNVALAGSPTTTTQSAHDNSTKIATTAYVDGAVSTGDSFTAITTGTNTSATMTVGTGASMTTSGSGTIAATSAPASGLTGTTLASGVVNSTLGSLGDIVAMGASSSTAVALHIGNSAGSVSSAPAIAFHSCNLPSSYDARIQASGGTGDPGAGQLHIDAATLVLGGTNVTSSGTYTGTWNGAKIGLAYGGTNADLSGTGGAANYLKQASSGAAITVGTIPASDLSNGTTGSGAVVLTTTPTIATPNITTGFTIGGAAASGKFIVGNGTNYVPSTPAYPNASVTAGKLIRSDGTNYAASTFTIPDTYTTGDIIQASASNVFSALTGVATGNALISGGVATANSWGKIGLTTHISGTLPVANGGTGQTSLQPWFDARQWGTCNLWLDATDPYNNNTQPATGTAITTGGSGWNDKSGNGYVAGQSTGADQPTWGSVSQNNLYGITFNGSSDFLSIPLFAVTAQMTMFVVSISSNYSLFIEHSPNINTYEGFYIYGAGSDAMAIRRSSTTVEQTASDWSGTSAIVMGMSYDGTTLKGYRSNTATLVTTTGALTNSTITNTLYIGSRGGTSLFTTGTIFEIIIYQNALAPNIIQYILAALKQKWGTV